MKTVLGCILFLLPCLTVLPQGQVVFNNRIFNAVVAPVYGVEPSNPELVKQGNTATGTPPGAQTYSGALLAGSGFTAQFFGGPTNVAEEYLRPLLPTTTFQTAVLAGFVIPPPNAINVADVPAGTKARLQLRCWDNRGGTITNWLQVMADSTIPRGSSLPTVSPPLGGTYLAPANPLGLESFNLTTGTVPAMRIRINFQTNGSPVAPGYFPDYGQVFGDRGNGFSYGWSADRSIHMRAQHSPNSPDPRYDSFMLMDSPTGAFWEIGLTNGVYRVHLAAGDPLSLNAVYRIEAEGVLAVNGTPVVGNNWIEGDAIVAVTNDTLSVRSADGSTNNRLCFLDIAPVSPPQMLPPTTDDFTSNQLRLALRGDPAVRHLIESSPDLFNWTVLGTADLITSNRFGFAVTLEANVQQQFYRARIAITSPPSP